MQTKAKSNSVVTHALAEDGCTITFKVKGASEFTFDVLSAHPNMQHRAAIHGFVQRISDGAALSRDTETGRPATPEEKFANMLRIAEHYATGVDQWKLNSDGTGEGRTSVVVQALAAIQGISVAEALAKVRETAEKRRVTTKAVLAKLRTTAAIASKIAEMATAAGGEDGDELLADLMGEEGPADEEEDGETSE